MSGQFTLSVMSDEEGGPAFKATVVLRGEELVITALSVRPGVDGELIPTRLVNEELAKLLAKVATTLKPGTLADTAEAAISAPAKNEAVPGSRLSTTKTPRRPRAGGPPSDLATIYWRLGTITKVANHYEVDKHIARKWINQLSNRTQSFSNGRRK